MMRLFIILLIILLIAVPTLLSAAVASESSSIRELLVDDTGTPYTGVAACKACIVSDGLSVWSNDGSSMAGSEPNNGFRVEVVDGVAFVKLGTPSMRPIFPEALGLFGDLTLRLWMDIGYGYKKLADRSLNQSDLAALDDATEESTEGTILPGIRRDSSLINQKIAEKSGKRKRLHPRSPGERARERYIQRAGPDGYIPMDALIKAKGYVDEMAARQQADKDGGIWSWAGLGPGNIGGRIRTILIHPTQPDKMWIGSVSGGIWKTTNAGSSWQAINDFLPNLNVTSMVMDPTNSNVIYAATGEGFGNSDALPGAGIFKSTDGGDHWFQLPSTANNDFRWVNRLAHHPTSTDTVYAVTDAAINRVWRTTNGGETWRSLCTLISDGTDVKVHPTQHNRVLVGTMNEVYYSVDPGWSFDEKTIGGDGNLPNDPGRCEVAFCPTASNVYYVAMERNGGEFWRSTNSGTSWELRNDAIDFYVGASNQGSYDNIIWVDPTDHLTVVVGGIDLWRTRDGGATFEKISMWEAYHIGLSAHADQHAIVHHPNFNGSTNTTVFVGNDGGIQKANEIYTVGELMGWENLANGLAITQFYAGAASPDGTEIYGGTQDNSTLRYKTEDGWNNWTQFITGDGGYCAVDPDWPNVVYSEYTHLNIYKSVSWGDFPLLKVNGLTDTSSANSLFIAPFRIAPDSPGVLYAGGRSIWKTENGADDWSSVRDPVGGSARCSAIDLLWSGDIVWVGYTNGHVAKTTNGGDTWEQVDTNATGWPSGRWVTDIAIDPVFPQRVWVTFSGYTSNNVWATEDGGATWATRVGTPPDTLPELPVNAITVHPVSTGRIYIGTDLGVFASDDHGYTWSTAHSYPDNEGPANVEVADLFWYGQTLVAATHGRGMYRTTPRIVVYVDRLAPSGGDGSAESPYRTLAEALNAAGHGTIIRIAEGTYDEGPLVISKKGKLEATIGNVILK